MQRKYMYNPNTGKLHIWGYCHISKLPPDKAIYFDSEDEALAYDGRAVSMCKICLRKWDKEMEIKK